MRTVNEINLNSIAAFVLVAEKHSFRGAARALGISKSTLSQRVAALEDQLGAQLLWRTTRSVRLTDIGESYYRAVAPALATISTAEELVGDFQGRPRGRLRLTAPVEMGQCILGSVLVEYARRYPDVEVTADLTDRRVSLIEEGFDLAIRIGPLEDSSLIRRRLSTLGPLRLFASPDYLLGHGTPRSPQELAEHATIVMSGSQDAVTWQLEGPQGQLAVPVKPRMTVGSWSIVRELAVAGLGIARLPELTGLHEAANGRLVEVLPEWAPPGEDCFAVYPGARNPSPALRAMIDLLIEHLANATYSCSAPAKACAAVRTEVSLPQESKGA